MARQYILLAFDGHADGSQLLDEATEFGARIADEFDLVHDEDVCTVLHQDVDATAQTITPIDACQSIVKALRGGQCGQDFVEATVRTLRRAGFKPSP